VAVGVLDESSEGLALEADGTLDCKIGDIVLVEIAGAWIEARVVNLCRTETAAEDSDAPPVEQTRIGLMRLKEIEASLADPHDFPLLSWMRIRSMLAPLVPLGKSVKGTAALIVAMLAATGLLIWVLENAAPWAEAMREQARQDDKLKEHLERFSPSGDEKESAASKPTPPEKPEKPEESPAPQEPKPDEPPPPHPADSLPAEVVRLAHPGFLLKPEIVKLLALTRKQRDALEQLFAEHKTASADPAASNGAQRDDDPIVALCRRALEILTAKQRQLLAQLHTAMQSLPAAAPGAPAPSGDGAAPPSGEAPPQVEAANG
jgi:hypothetical protein